MRARQKAGLLRGFTLFEALIAMALMGLVLAILGRVTAQWLPAWHAGFIRVQHSELLGLGLDRITADLAAAEFISLSSANKHPYFEGTPTSATFVRTALGPNTRDGLEVVRLFEMETQRGFAFMRAQAPFRLSGQQGNEATDLVLGNETTLVPPPFRITLAYAGRDRRWQDIWSGNGELPNMVRITISASSAEGAAAASTIALVRIGSPAACARANSASTCLDELARTGETKSESDPDAPPIEPPPPAQSGRGLVDSR
jgi:general secretion pathway protein J